MGVKDPRINTVIVSGKVVETCQERASGEFVNAKVKIEIFNLYYNSETKKREYKPIVKEVKTLGRSDSKPGSPLAIMRGLKEGERAVFTGAMECDYWTWNDKECSKEFLNASRIQTFEMEDKAPRPSAPAPDPGSDDPPEDDIPF